MERIIMPLGAIGANCVVLWEDPAAAWIVDPGAEPEAVNAFLDKKGLTPALVLLTHGHFDHIWAAASVARHAACPVYLSVADDPVLKGSAAMLERLQLEKPVEPFVYQDMADGQVLHAGGVDWKVIATPGHSPGSVCYLCAEWGVLLSGDTLFSGSIGRSDLPGGDYDQLMKSLMDKVMTLPGDTDVLPGHGRPTTIARESATNPFLLPFNEPDTAWWDQDGIELEGR